MKEELDRVLDRLPRGSYSKPPKIGLNALIFIDPTGAMQIWVDGGGWMKLDERHLSYLVADAEGL